MSSRDNAFDSEKRIYTMDKWLTILKLATKFQCLNLHKEALLSLESSWVSISLETGVLSPSLMKLVQMGRSFWVILGYYALVERECDISEEEMLEIGSVEAFRLMCIWEKKKACAGFSVGTAIRQAFQQEITSIAAKEKKFSDAQVFLQWRIIVVKSRCDLQSIIS